MAVASSSLKHVLSKTPAPDLNAGTAVRRVLGVLADSQMSQAEPDDLYLLILQLLAGTGPGGL